MARHLNANWKLPEKIENWEQVRVAVLMDIRDELQALNDLLQCPAFKAIPRTLEKIERNTKKPKRKREPTT